MASAAPATSVTMLVAAVLLVLLHSAMGHQQPPAHHSKGLQPTGRARHCPDHNEQPPPPTPTPPTPSPPPPPTPMPTPPAAAPPPALTPTTTPAPAPAPAVDCPAYCGKHCNQECLANMSAGAKKCETDYASNMSGCYDSCTANMCPGKCVDSGCSVDNCYTGCDNTYARSCCDECHRGLYPSYSSCVNYYNRADGYCIGKCTDDCYKKCTQG